MTTDRRHLDDMMRDLCGEVARDAAIEASRAARGLPARTKATVEAKALAWRIFDTAAACVGVAIIAGTLALVCATLRGHDVSPFAMATTEAGQ